MKFAIAAAFIVVGIISSWFFMSENNSESVSVSEPRIDSNKAASTTGPLSQSIPESAVLPPDAVSQEIADSDQVSVATRSASPFDVVDEGEDTPQTAQADRMPSEQVARTAGQATASDTELQAVEPLVVPESYPVSDAEKYYIPREQRGAGRLGGPPPMDFAFGRDDDTGAAPGGFSPPPAPGQ